MSGCAGCASDHARDFALLSFNMSTIFHSIVESHDLLVKGSRPQVHQPDKTNEAEPGFIVAEHTTENQDLAALQDWLRTGSSCVLKIQNISLEQTEHLREKLQAWGHKVRCVILDIGRACSSPCT